MEIQKDVYFRVWALFISWLLSEAKAESRCTQANIKVALQRCNAQLSFINNAVLLGKTDNYTNVCSAFSAFITCVDPRITTCPSQMMKPYLHTRDTYSKAPYNCSVPSPSRREEKRQYRDQDKGYGYMASTASSCPQCYYHYYFPHIASMTLVIGAMVLRCDAPG